MTYSRILLLWATLIGTLSGLAQQPLYKQIGQNDVLRGIEIYGIAQDLTRNIWLTTSNGVYKYDGLDFTNYKNEKLGGNDFFQPTITKSGRLYFTTIAGDIYTLENEEIVLFKENDVPNAHETNSIISSNNYLYTFSTDSLYQIDSLGNRKCIFGYPGAFFKLTFRNFKSSKNIALYTSGLHKSIQINGAQVTVKNNANSIFDKNNKNTEKYFLINGSPKFFTRKFQGHFYHYQINDANDIVPINEDENIAVWYTCSNNNQWVIKNFENGLVFTRSGGQKPQKILADFTVNYLFEDVEGNIWVGTKNNGLILINNVNNYLLETEEPLQGLELSFNSIFSYSSNNAFILNPKNNRVSVIPNRDASANVHMFGDRIRKNAFYIQNSDGIQHYNNFNFGNKFISKTWLIKRHHWLKDSAILLSSIHGAFVLLPNKASSEIQVGPQNIRCLDAIWVKSVQKFFVASSKGLVSCYKNGKVHKNITYNQIPLDIQLLFDYENSIYAISTSGKIYKINTTTYQTKYISQIEENTLVSGIKKNSSIYLIDKQKIFEFNCKREILKELPLQLSPTMQLTGGAFYNNALWLSTNKGFLNYAINSLDDDKNTPNMFIDVINNKRNLKVNKATFSHTQNHFIFKVRNRDFKHHGLSKIHYQLIGYDTSSILIGTNKGDIEYKSLSPGRYTFKAQIISPFGYSNDWQEFSFEIKPPYWQSWWFIALSILLFITLFSFYTGYRQRSKHIKRELERRLIESELTAIKAQMNPHFIFNCLNSIQDLILKQDARASNKYLGLFSDLVRKTMEDSNKESVDLTRELNLLRLYLELEKLRFVDLDYKIIHSFSSQFLDEHAIPPMLVQPFLENALKHGLMHLKGEKKLVVQVIQEQEDLTFLIKDNGIGLEEGKKIKKRQSKYRSFSGDAISKRIDLINSEGAFNVNFEIFDYSEDPSNKWTTIVELRFNNYFTL